MKSLFLICAALIVAISPMSAQMVTSHGTPSVFAPVSAPTQQALAKPVARINGTVLTDRDLVREEYAIFPYAKTHSGIPKNMEPEIRKGAMQMIVFEELVYQDAERRKLAVSQAKMDQAMVQFKKQFKSPDEYQEFLKVELGGSQELLRKNIRRSLLVDQYLKLEVQDKAAVSLAQARIYYDKNPDKFRTPETYSVQSISIVPPAKATAEQMKEARKHGEAALVQAKATKNYEEFGVLAEKISEDDYRVMMGDHKAVDKGKLPPTVLQAVVAMQVGQVSGLIPIENIFVILRLNAHNPAGMQKFEDVKDSIRKELASKKTEELRGSLNKKLRANAKVEEL